MLARENADDSGCREYCGDGHADILLGRLEHKTIVRTGERSDFEMFRCDGCGVTVVGDVFVYEDGEVTYLDG